MSFSGTTDRRRHPRANLAAPCPCFFHIHGKRYPAFMVDVSAGGAGFRNFEIGAPLSLTSGENTHFDVITPHGRGTYNGLVVWAAVLEGGHGWGLRLVETVRHGEGPLGSLLAAALPMN
jgi:hypothetical protein